MHTQGPWEWKDDMGLVVGPADDPAGNPVAEIIGHPGEASGSNLTTENSEIIDRFTRNMIPDLIRARRILN